MGNQGMTNWKLSALFAISLMLIAGLFSNAAIAADGDGTVSMQWMHDDPALDAVFRYGDQLYEYDRTGGNAGFLWDPLPAGSRENQLMFSYRVGTNMAGGEVKFHLPAGWKILKLAENITHDGFAEGDTDTVVDDAYARYSAAAVVEVQEDLDGGDVSSDDPLTIYRLNRDGETVVRDSLTDLISAVVAGADGADDEDVANAGRVSIGDDDTSITVKLSNDWRSGGELVVVLRNVQTAVPRSLPSTTVVDVDENPDLPYHNYPIVVKSKKSGRLDQLDPVRIDHDGDNADGIDSTDTAMVYSRQPAVKVGNILGERGVAGANGGDDDGSRAGAQYYGPDQIAREFKVEPTDVWEGEANKTFMVSFTAKGPMYDAAGQDATIAITIPAELQPTAFGPDIDLTGYIMNHVSVTASGRVQPSGNLGVGTEITDEVMIADGLVTINLDRIDNGAKVVLTYTFEGGDDYGDATITDDGAVDLADVTGATEISAFIATTMVPTGAGDAGTDAVATSIAGGNIRPQDGSGTLTFKDDQVEAGDDVSKITLIYEADTALSGVTLEVDVKGIQLVDDDANVKPDITSLQDGDDNLYGFVEGTGTTSNPGLTLTERTDVTTIAFDGLTFTKAGEKFTITIENVRIQEDGANLDFNTRIAPDGTTLADADHGLAKNPTLYITDTMDDAVEFKINDNTFASFRAAEEVGAITFTFEAKTTSIKDGQVRFAFPRNWTRPVKPLKDNEIKAQGQLVVGGGGTTDDNRVGNVSTSGQTVTVKVPMLKIGEKVTISINGFTGDDEIAKMVTVQPNATEEDEYETITGYFWTSSPIRGRGHTAGTVDVEILNAADGYGDATISPSSIKAGSDDNQITVEFTAAGTMDGGAVRLVIPDGWGSLQDDDATEANYVEVDVRGRGEAEANVGSSAAIAYLEGVVKGSKVIFTYGGGTVRSRNGAEVQPTIAVADPAAFMIETDGDGDNSFELVRGMQRTKAAIAASTDAKTIPLGKVYRDRLGELRVEVTGADDGSGTAEVEIANTGQGEAMYPDDEDVDGDRDRTELVDGYRIHAGDMGTYLMFTYTPSQTIQDGQLKFAAQGEWSDPQNNPGTAGYTYFSETGTADIDHIEFDEDDGSVTLDLAYVDPEGTIEIHYGAYEGEDDGSGAQAPSSATSSSAFTVQIRGGNAASNRFSPIKTLKGKSIAVRVYAQASGGGNAMASVSDNEGDLGAGDTDRKVTIVYTAAGEINNGMLKLTIPDGWSHPLMANVAITSRGSIGSSSASDFGGYYVGDPDDADDDMEVPEGGPGAMDVLVDGINLDAGETVTFVYSAAMVQPTTGDASFGVAVAGGDGPGEDPAGVTADPSDALTVSVGDASPGSGSGMLELAQAVIANTGGNTLTFIYTPAGQITDRSRDFRVDVPSGWSEPTDSIDTDAQGSFTVTQKKLDGEVYKLQTAAATAVEKIGPFDRQIAARLKFGQSVGAGDQIIFTYENADAPTTIGPSTFVMYFGESQVTTDTDLTVLVGSGKTATMLMVDAPNELSVDTGGPVMITVTLQDEDGNEVPAETDLDVGLASSNSDTGSFMVDGDAVEMVTITAGMNSAMAYYTDSAAGTTATITASADGLEGMADIMVTSDVVEITSATVTPKIAKAGGMVTVSATGTAGKTAMFSVGSIVTDGSMTEDEAGSYSGMFDVVVDQHADGAYDVTVSINGTSSTLTGALTLDSTGANWTGFSVFVDSTLADLADTVANGDTVTLSARLDDGTGSGIASVMVDVSELDSTQGMVELMMGDDGSYSADITISEDNEASNGVKTVTADATDRAGNSSGPADYSITLENSISFTLMVTANLSLFHMPLDDDDIDTVGDLRAALGGDNVTLLAGVFDGNWGFADDDMTIAADLGLLVNLTEGKEITFTGRAWGEGSAIINLNEGPNLIGLPVNDERINKVSDIMAISGGTVTSIIVLSDDGAYQLVASPGDPADGEVAGDVAYLVNASAIAVPIPVTGDGWMNGDAAGAAPIALAGYTVDNQTPALAVHGSVVDEITGLAREGFRVKVKNLETKAALSEVTSAETADGYNMLFVDLVDAHAARVGDVLEITADSPNPLIGVKPVRHIVTVDDVKNSTIQLEELIAYEIPAETELLRNYPNPFNPETWIPYRLAEDANVSLTIYGTSGALVRSIDIGHQTAAVYETRAKAIYWDGRNRFGEQVASGIYFYSLSTGDFSATRKMVILK